MRSLSNQRSKVGCYRVKSHCACEDLVIKAGVLGDHQEHRSITPNKASECDCQKRARMPTNCKINLERWSHELKDLFAEHDLISVRDDPAAYFEGVFSSCGFPAGPDFRQIWFEQGLVIDSQTGGCHFASEEGIWKSIDSEYRIFWLSAEAVSSEASRKYWKTNQIALRAGPKRSDELRNQRTPMISSQTGR